MNIYKKNNLQLQNYFYVLENQETGFGTNSIRIFVEE